MDSNFPVLFHCEIHWNPVLSPTANIVFIMEYPDTVSVSSSGHQQQRKAVKFSSTFSTYMTLLGYALGFADIWRFPFLVYRNGGGFSTGLVALKAGFRIPTLIVITVVMFVLSLPTCTGAGAYIFLLIDWYAGSWTGTIVALIEVILFLSCVEYVPPNYGSYHYPGYAQAIGWGTVVVTVAPIFGYAILNLYRAKGTVSQRISSLCRPTDTWGPCGDRMDCNYRKNKIKYSERTFWDLFYFNVFGRYPKNSAINLLLDHELTILKS
ncbi:S6A14-like protein [Mya arenaria]|uniref:S6A14-like protein n=1 Tax=Mya arenaria TaxID=6604 RepID=A0ABY7E2H8_MYAAR|nr:S6A14-like protein [Mya arenaria]